MEILINGENREVPSPINVRELLRLLELKEDRVAVELNREIVRREKWAQIPLREQDRLEIVQFVGGG
ncbi:MAG: thiamine biosynthesis protein ThiS [Acidobacteria bacterium RIFCSPLOWO2_02_FULL_59_13]|nr:MAG: thiamine biosynthesis protein ThiS [Acidobacteria bacterium RIFCSPLOWO2_02_FULL_59_13]